MLVRKHSTPSGTSAECSATLPEVTVESTPDRFWLGLPLRPSVITIVRFMLGAVEDANLANFHGTIFEAASAAGRNAQNRSASALVTSAL